MAAATGPQPAGPGQRPGDSASRGEAPSLPSSEQMLRKLEWDVIRRLDGLLQGDYRTLLRGGGVDLADLREYQPSDDVRHIDWNVTARLQQPYVRQFLEDRDLTAWFLLDLSGSVDFGSSDVTKLAVSAGFVATMARVITRRGNRVGAVLFGGQAVDGVLQPGATRLHVLQLLQRMQSAARRHGRAGPQGQAAAPTAAAATAPPGGTSLTALLHTGAAVIPRRSLVFVVSDFISTPGWEDALGRLARRHEVVAVRLWDPLEMALPDVGLVTVEDAETGEQLFIDASDPDFRARYAAEAERQEAALFDALSRSGADILELATDDDLLDALMRFTDLRRQRARARTPVRFPTAFRRAASSSASALESAP
jgi:uncharacterized protein (DUF58 family)